MADGFSPPTPVGAILATWPAAEMASLGGFVLRRGSGGGNRTSAATRIDRAVDITLAEAAMRRWGQGPLFLVAPGDTTLDGELADRGYAVHDATLVLEASAAELVGEGSERAIVGDVPLAAMRDVWAAGGVGPERLAVMERVSTPKAYLLGRDGDRVAGAGFVAIADGFAVLHAVEVASHARRRGVGAAMVRAAAAWGIEAGAERVLLAVTRANLGAQALYHGLGFAEVASYHYRRLP